MALRETQFLWRMKRCAFTLLLLAGSINAVASSLNDDLFPILPNAQTLELVPAHWAIADQRIVTWNAEAARRIMRETTEYMQRQQEQDEEMTDRCKALHDGCSYWASIGMQNKG